MLRCPDADRLKAQKRARQVHAQRALVADALEAGLINRLRDGRRRRLSNLVGNMSLPVLEPDVKIPPNTVAKTAADAVGGTTTRMFWRRRR